MQENSFFNGVFSELSDEVKKKNLNTNLHIRVVVCIIFATCGIVLQFIP